MTPHDQRVLEVLRELSTETAFQTPLGIDIHRVASYLLLQGITKTSIRRLSQVLHMRQARISTILVRLKELGALERVGRTVDGCEIGFDNSLGIPNTDALDTTVEKLDDANPAFGEGVPTMGGVHPVGCTPLIPRDAPASPGMHPHPQGCTRIPRDAPASPGMHPPHPQGCTSDTISFLERTGYVPHGAEPGKVLTDATAFDKLAAAFDGTIRDVHGEKGSKEE